MEKNTEKISLSGVIAGPITDTSQTALSVTDGTNDEDLYLLGAVGGSEAVAAGQSVSRCVGGNSIGSGSGDGEAVPMDISVVNEELEALLAALRLEDELSPEEMEQKKREEIFQKKAKHDAKSVYVKNVEYRSTAEEVMRLFEPCGPLYRVTIPHNGAGMGRGFAYVEFMTESSVEAALAMTGKYFNGRIITVLKKRTNMPNFQGGPTNDYARPGPSTK